MSTFRILVWLQDLRVAGQAESIKALQRSLRLKEEIIRQMDQAQQQQAAARAAARLKREAAAGHGSGLRRDAPARSRSLSPSNYGTTANRRVRSQVSAVGGALEQHNLVLKGNLSDSVCRSAINAGDWRDN